MTVAAAPSGTAGPLGLLIVLLIGVAMVLLIRNMNGRLRRLPPSFEPPSFEPPSFEPPAETTGQPSGQPADAAPGDDERPGEDERPLPAP